MWRTALLFLAARQPTLVERIAAIMHDAHVDNAHWKWPTDGGRSRMPIVAGTRCPQPGTMAARLPRD